MDRFRGKIWKVGEFQKRRSCHYTRDLRARDLPPHLKIYQTAADVPKKVKKTCSERLGFSKSDQHSNENDNLRTHQR